MSLSRTWIKIIQVWTKACHVSAVLVTSVMILAIITVWIISWMKMKAIWLTPLNNSKNCGKRSSKTCVHQLFKKAKWWKTWRETSHTCQIRVIWGSPSLCKVDLIRMVEICMVGLALQGHLDRIYHNFLMGLHPTTNSTKPHLAQDHPSTLPTAVHFYLPQLISLVLQVYLVCHHLILLLTISVCSHLCLLTRLHQALLLHLVWYHHQVVQMVCSRLESLWIQ